MKDKEFLAEQERAGKSVTEHKLNQSHRVAVIAIGADGNPTFWPNFETAVAIWKRAQAAMMKVAETEAKDGEAG